MMKTRFLVCYLLVVMAIPSSGQALPQMDGIASPGEWDNAELHQIELTTGIVMNLSIIYTSTDVYYLASIDHSADVNTINLDPAQDHDYFGLEFDNNADDAIMGTPVSPDDTIMVNYEVNEASDMYMHSYKAFYDTENRGEDNVEGKAGTDGENLFFEIKKPLISSDERGFDFDLQPGSTYQIMVGFWDDEPPHSATAAFNKRVDNDQFLTLTVNGSVETTDLEIMTIVALILAASVGILVSRSGISGIQKRLQQLVT